jgi:hypothetical protein
MAVHTVTGSGLVVGLGWDRIGLGLAWGGLGLCLGWPKLGLEWARRGNWCLVKRDTMR